MILLNVNNISKSFGVTTVLDQIDLVIDDRDRIGLVGKNGAGKSTLLKVITGQMLPDTGSVTLAKNKTMDYLAQDSGLDSTKTIWNEMRTVFQAVIEKEQELRDLENQMGDPKIIENAAAYERLMDTYARLSEAFQQMDGFSYQAHIRSLLTGLGFDASMWNQAISSLSGGQKTRLAMVKLLLTKPDLLILDEPTNFLDIETLTWLEGYLQSYPGAILVVSHDRYFLDRIVTNIYEIENTHGKRYAGNYSFYQMKKAEELTIAQKQFEMQQEEIKRLEDFVQKNIARASTTKRAQSRRKTLEKMERLEKPSQDSTLTAFSFEIDRITGNDVLTVRNLAIGYEGKTLSQNINLTIERGDRISIVGPNGVGKSTLLKTLINQLEPKQGEFHWGSHVKLGYYDQEQTNLHEEKRVLDEIWDDYPMMPEVEVRTLLGRFLFKGEEVEKRVSSLSGGEKARLALAKLFLTKANVLLLDEPTNHLDLYSKEVLEQALLDYPGTLIFISHDRYFLNKISTRTLELSATGIASYLGNYDYYLEKKEELRENQKNQQPTSVNQAISEAAPNFDQMKENKKRLRQLERRLQELEDLIHQSEQDIEALHEESCKPEVFQDHEKSLSIQNTIKKTQEQLDQWLQEWEEVTIALEETQSARP